MSNHARPFLLVIACCCAALSANMRFGTSAQTQSTRRVTFNTHESLSLNPTLSGDGRRVVFETTAAPAGGVPGFRTVSATVFAHGFTLRELAASRAPAPAVSQDGSRVAFSSMSDPAGRNPDGNPEIFLHDGLSLTQL
ncbi:MAG TPA: hypothetical protein VF240_15995, partial [Pyrinomonadaceae bacterium]